MSRCALTLVACCSLCTLARTQTPTAIVETGDLIAGFGTVLNVHGLAVDNAGHVLARARTNNPNPDQAEVLLDENGMVMAWAGEPLANGLIRDFQGGFFSGNSLGTPTMNLRVLGDPGGIYTGLPPVLTVRKSSISTAPQLSPGSQIGSMGFPLVNASNVVAFIAYITDPAIPGVQKALFVIDSVTGAQNVIVKTTDILPGQTQPLNYLDLGPHDLAFNDSGHVMFTGGVATSNGGVVYHDLTKVMQVGEPSPFGGAYVGAMAVGLNAVDDHVFTCHLSDIDHEWGIVTSHGAFARSGDSFPSIEPYKFNWIGNPVFLGDDGRAYWMGSWDLPSGPDAFGIFTDYTPVVRTDTTLIGGVPIQLISGLDGCFTVSRNGRFVLFEATLQNGVTGSYLVDLGL